MTMDLTSAFPMGSSALPTASVVVPKQERSRLRRLGDDLGYLLLAFPLALTSFVVLVTLVSLAGGLLVIGVGVPLLAGTLWVAQAFAGLERVRLRWRGEALAEVVYEHAPAGASWWTRMWAVLRDPQRWLETVHGVVSFGVSLITWVVAVVWVSCTVGGLTYVVWGRFLPPDQPDNDSLAELLDIGLGNTVIYTLLGLIGLVTLLPVIRACAEVQAGLARVLVANDRVAELRTRALRMRQQHNAAAEVEVDERRRLERDIHDGPQQRLVRLGMDLAAAERRMDDDPEAARQLLAEAREHTANALEELRLLSRGIAPPLLADRGLGVALVDVACRSAIPVDVDVQLAAGERLPARVENALYFTVSEALTNVAKHADAHRARVIVQRSDDGQVVQARISDDGIGGADAALGHGLAGLRDRLAALGGSLDVQSPIGGPTILTAELPCGS